MARIYYYVATLEALEGKKECDEIFIKANRKSDVIKHLKDAFKYRKFSVRSCTKEEFDNVWQWITDFYCYLSNNQGKIDLTEREFLIWWERREHDGEYARVLRRENFIVKAKTTDVAQRLIKRYVVRKGMCYADDYTFLVSTDWEEDIEKVKSSKDYIYVNFEDCFSFTELHDESLMAYWD